MSTQSGTNITLSTEDLLERLKRSLMMDGDFPASAQAVTELRRLAADPRTTANQVTEVILQEPSLGARVLHVVNSSFYRRAKPIVTVSQAVVQIGMRPLAELCGGLILLQRFVPAARKGGAFASCLQRTLTTSLLANSITKEVVTSSQTSQRNEQGYLAGSFSEMGVLLLAFYFPKIYETCLQRAKAKRIELSQGIEEITGLTSLQLSSAVITSLNLPPFYNELICELPLISEKKEKGGPLATVPLKERLGKVIFAAREVAETLSDNPTRRSLEIVLKNVADVTGIDTSQLAPCLATLPAMFDEHCQILELDLPSLPEELLTFSNATDNAAEELTEAELAQVADSDFSSFVQEIKEAVDNREPAASIITRVMETLVWNLGFSRSIFLIMNPEKTGLRGRLALGDMKGIAPQSIFIDLSHDNRRSAVAKTLAQSRPVFQGEPILEEGWPFVVFPIGFESRTIGVIYGDCVDSSLDELNSKVVAAVSVLTELLDRSIRVTAK